VAALKRAGKRAAVHLLRAAVEALKAVEAVVDELGGVGRDEEGDEGQSRTEHIEVR
jgi:hypothetical protein